MDDSAYRGKCRDYLHYYYSRLIYINQMPAPPGSEYARQLLTGAVH